MTGLPAVKVTLEPAIIADGFNVHVIAGRRGPNVEVLAPIPALTIVSVPPGGAYERTPAFMLDHQAAQAFMDGLWQAGVRPSMVADSTGELAATKRHLEDMRALAGVIPSKHDPDVPLTL